MTFWPLASFWPAGLAPLAVADAALAVQQLRACALTRDREARSRSSTASSLRHSCTPVLHQVLRHPLTLRGERLAAGQTRAGRTAGESGGRPPRVVGRRRWWHQQEASS